MINQNDLLEDLEWDGTTIVIKKLIEIVEAQDERIRELEKIHSLQQYSGFLDILDVYDNQKKLTEFRQ